MVALVLSCSILRTAADGVSSLGNATQAASLAVSTVPDNSLAITQLSGTPTPDAGIPPPPAVGTPEAPSSLLVSLVGDIFPPSPSGPPCGITATVQAGDTISTIM